MKKYKIGYTTGVFDLLHRGHLEILRKSKELCDELIVGVSTDELTYEYKGHYPVVPFEERKEIVEAIRYVDKVVPQTSMDKLAAWESLHYNALFHGDDWKNSSIYRDAEDRLKEVGVDVVFFKYTESVSSSIRKENISERR